MSKDINPIMYFFKNRGWISKRLLYIFLAVFCVMFLVFVIIVFLKIVSLEKAIDETESMSI